VPNVLYQIPNELDMFLVLQTDEAVMQLVSDAVRVSTPKKQLVLTQSIGWENFQHADDVALGSERQL
jgi:hypothetical protein